jgi:hypothetical protein
LKEDYKRDYRDYQFSTFDQVKLKKLTPSERMQVAEQIEEEAEYVVLLTEMVVNGELEEIDLLNLFNWGN